MKSMRTALLWLSLVAGLDSLPSQTLGAASTISPIHHNAWAANIGWIDALAEPGYGAVIGEYVCSGYLYSANVGWIHLGNGAPADNIQYRNTSPTDFGVNHDGVGNLRGNAYGANIGWIRFEATGSPRLDLKTGQCTGYAYSANCGWISLGNTAAYLQTDFILPGLDTDGDGLADAWELIVTNSLTPFTATSDADGDDASDLDEYRAGTNPLDPNDRLRISDYQFANEGKTAILTWTSVSNRCYYVRETMSLEGTPVWFDSGLGLIPPSPGPTTSRSIIRPAAPIRVYQVEAVRPLSP